MSRSRFTTGVSVRLSHENTYDGEELIHGYRYLEMEINSLCRVAIGDRLRVIYKHQASLERHSQRLLQRTKLNISYRITILDYFLTSYINNLMNRSVQYYLDPSLDPEPEPSLDLDRWSRDLMVDPTLDRALKIPISQHCTSYISDQIHT